MSSGLSYTIWSIEFMALGLVSKVFLIDPIECLRLILHVILWDLSNMQSTQGGIFLILMSFLGITPLLYILMRDLNDQWFSMWFQTRRSLSSRHRRSLVDHSLDMSSLVR